MEKPWIKCAPKASPRTMNKKLKIKKGLEQKVSRSSGYEISIKFRKIPLLVMYYLSKFDDVI